MTKLVDCLSRENKKVVTLKHHGHGGKPDIFDEKDSSLHIKAGAYASLVEGDGRILLQAEKQGWTLKEKIELLSFLHPDFIIIEGHKNENYPKAVIVKHSEDLELLDVLNNIIAVFYWNEAIVTKKNNDIPYMNLHDEASLFWLRDYLIHQQVQS